MGYHSSILFKVCKGDYCETYLAMLSMETQAMVRYSRTENSVRLFQDRK